MVAADAQTSRAQLRREQLRVLDRRRVDDAGLALEPVKLILNRYSFETKIILSNEKSY